METEKMDIIDAEGNKKEVNFITVISLEKYSSAYLVYCEDEMVDGENTISIAKMVEHEDGMYLENISKEEFADVIKEINKELTRNE